MVSTRGGPQFVPAPPEIPEPLRRVYGAGDPSLPESCGGEPLVVYHRRQPSRACCRMHMQVERWWLGWRMHGAA